MDSLVAPRRGSRRPAFTLLVFTGSIATIGVVSGAAIFFLWEFPLASYYVTFGLSIFTLLAAFYGALRAFMQMHAPGASVAADYIERFLFPFLVFEEFVDYIAERSCLKKPPVLPV